MVITYVKSFDEFQKHRNFASPVFGISDQSVVSNTFNYIVSQIKKGIFIKIFNNCLVNFIVFNVTDNVENSWSHKIQVNPAFFENVESFLKHVYRKSGFYFRPENVQLDPAFWRCNNGLLRYEIPAVDNRKNVETIHDMFQQLCDSRTINNCEFFVNKRDFPIKRLGPFEPFHHIWDSKRKHLENHNYSEYAPIMSQCSESDFADIAIPTFDDWNLVRRREDGVVFEDARVGKISKLVPWDEKKNKAVFRGTSTGIGTTEKNNTRMKLVKMCQKFPNLFDVGFTKINYRVRKQYKNPYIQTVESSFPTTAPLSLQEQMQFKFIINVEGHSASFRLSSELLSGSCVLLVESRWTLWMKDFLEPYVHYVPVKADLSDLVSKMRWCLDNDTLCREIAARAGALTQISKNGIFDFLQKIINSWQKQLIYNEPVNVDALQTTICGLHIPALETGKIGIPMNSSESQLLLFLTICHANEKFYLNFNNDEVTFVDEKKKRCVSFMYASKIYQFWTSLTVYRKCGAKTSFLLNDTWYGVAIFDPYSDLKSFKLPFENNISSIMEYSNMEHLSLREEACISKYENKLFSLPIYVTNNSFLLTYYCVEILQYIPKTVQTQKSLDSTWTKWSDTFHFLTTFYNNNVDKTSPLALEYKIFTFPCDSKELLVDFSKWNRKIKFLLQYSGMFCLSKKDKKFYSAFFQPLLNVPENYSFLIGSHNAVVTQFQTTTTK